MSIQLQSPQKIIDSTEHRTQNLQHASPVLTIRPQIDVEKLWQSLIRYGTVLMLRAWYVVA